MNNIILTDEKYDLLDLCRLAQQHQTQITIQMNEDGIEVEITPWGDEE